MRAQTSHSDLERQVKKLTRAVKRNTQRNAEFGVGAQDAYATALRSSVTRAPYMLPLGNSSVVSEKMRYAPAWEIKALKNEFTSSMSYASSSYENITKIPQLEVHIDYTTEIHKTEDAMSSEVWNEGLTHPETEFDDDVAGEALPGSGQPRDMLSLIHI